MCSRFQLTHDRAMVADAFGLTVPPPWTNASDIRPTDLALGIGRRQCGLLRWGLKVDWDKALLINARSETVPEKPVFRRLLGQRLIIPASAWWEWDSAKTRHRLTAQDGRILGLAALYDLECFVILTRAASPDLVWLHDRMPVIVDGEWLQGGPPRPLDMAIQVQRDEAPKAQASLF